MFRRLILRCPRSVFSLERRLLRSLEECCRMIHFFLLLFRGVVSGLDSLQGVVIRQDTGEFLSANPWS